MPWHNFKKFQAQKKKLPWLLKSGLIFACNTMEIVFFFTWELNFFFFIPALISMREFRGLFSTVIYTRFMPIVEFCQLKFDFYYFALFNVQQY